MYDKDNKQTGNIIQHVKSMLHGQDLQKRQSAIFKSIYRQTKIPQKRKVSGVIYMQQLKILYMASNAGKNNNMSLIHHANKL